MKPASRPARKVLLVVPGRLFRDGLKCLLQNASIAVVGDCDTLTEAGWVLAECEQPDLMVVSAQGGDALDDLAELRALRQRMPGTRWMVLCKMPVTDLLRDAVGNGIDGILLQDTPADILHHVVELMLLGHSLVPREFATRLAAREEPGSSAQPAAAPAVAGPAARGGAADAEPGPMPAVAQTVAAAFPEPEMQPARRHILDEPQPLPEAVPPSVRADAPPVRAARLSDREAEILQCLMNGASNKLIARDLKIAEATVKVHVKGLLRKMQLQNRTQAAIWAVNNAPATKTPGNGHDRTANGFTPGTLDGGLEAADPAAAWPETA